MAEPIFYLVAAPKEQVQMPTLTREEGVRQFLENPPHARYEGSNLLTLERAELVSGPRLHVHNGKRKFIDLNADGTLTAIGTFDGFLGWGRWQFAQRPKVNGLAVVEFTHEFVSFYERLLHEYVEPIPAEVRFAVGVRHAHYEHEGEERKLYLSPGPLSDMPGSVPQPRSCLRWRAAMRRIARSSNASMAGCFRQEALPNADTIT